MKTKSTYIILFIASLLFTRCEDKIYETFRGNSPVYMSYEELRSAVVMGDSRELEKPGKIYFKDDFVFINEIMEGIHVFDVSDPANPENVGFINIPGNVDIAIKEDVLYADSYVDLVAINVSDLSGIQEVGRIEDIFPYTIPEYDTDYRLGEIDEDKGVVVDWEIVEIKQEIRQYHYPIYYATSFAENMAMDGAFYSAKTNGVGGSAGTTFGVGGSMARFGLYKDFLYTVDHSTLHTFRIADLESPVEVGSKSIGWDVETMFIYNDHLFFGTRNGMLVYNLEIEQNPSYINQYSHITSCDPVVVQGNLAYVTLHDGGACGRAANRLDVIELNEDYSQMQLLKSYSMANPHGLGIDDEILFICDGDAGLKVYNVSDPLQIAANKIAEFPDISTYDVIPVNGYLFMIGDGGFHLYDYSDIQNITLLSTIPVSEASN